MPALAAAMRDPAQVRGAAREILDQPQFQPEDRGLLADIYYYLVHPDEALFEAWNWLAMHLPWNDTGATIFAWLLVVAIVTGSLFALVRLGRSTVVDAGVEVRMPALAHTLTADDLLREADRYEQDGEWKLALRARYGALLARLEEAGVVQRRAGRTTGEYVDEVQTNAPALLASFAAATSIFELAWYGNRATTADDVAELRALAAGFKMKKVA